MEAFELNDEARGEGFSGGTIMCSPAGHALDVKQALDQGDGVIVTDSPTLIPLLRAYPALKSTVVPDDAVPIMVPGQDELVASTPPMPYTPQVPPELTSPVLTEQAPPGSATNPIAVAVNEQAPSFGDNPDEDPAIAGTSEPAESAGAATTGSFGKPSFE